MRRLALLPALLACAPAFAGAHLSPRHPRPVIQVALLLDTSNSMDGLINQAKTQLWTFVNEFAPLKRDGQAPELQVALYEYGKSSIPAGEGYIRMVLPFTTDLDQVSQQLFALTTQGGDEFCGQVIQCATDSLAWSSAPRDLKVIFIAGNEPFTQGTVDYHGSCTHAWQRGITVNTIFCGSHAEGVATKWADGAQLGGGSYMAIDQERKAVQISAPMDKEIDRLGQELNKTYVPLGEAGARGASNQVAQDANAAQAGVGSASQRVAAKASGFYRNETWDLVDAEQAGHKKLEALDKKDLPKEMQSLTKEEARRYVDAKAKARADIQAKIQKLSAEREKFLAAKRKEMASSSGAKTLDTAMVETLRVQAKGKGFSK